jgi:hypothetical protein
MAWAYRPRFINFPERSGCGGDLVQADRDSQAHRETAIPHSPCRARALPAHDADFGAKREGPG